MELKPVIKWAGGKRQIIEDIFKLLPNKINIYYEPFLGGGSVFLKLLEKCNNKNIVVNQFILNDKNTNLINLYLSIKNNINELLDYLKIITNNYYNAKDIKYESRHKCNIEVDMLIDDIIDKGKLYVFYFYRNEYNNIKTNKIKKSELFIFLNKTCFRGLYREAKNKFNVPFGNYKSPFFYNENYLNKLNLLFNKYNILFLNKNFIDIKYDLSKDNFIYLDPPYYPIKENSFVDYQKSGFREEENIKLIKLCDTFNNNKIKFIHSNSYCSYNINNYNKYSIEKILCKRRINSKNPEDVIYEILIFN